MPSTSAKQHRFMQAVAHSPSFAKKAGVSQSVGKDFSAADKGKTFNKGGTMKKGKRFNGEDGESGVEYRDYDPDKTYSGRFADDETGGLAENTPRRSTAKATPAAPSRAPAPAARTTARTTARTAAPVASSKANSDPNRRTTDDETYRPIRDNASADIARKDRNTSGFKKYYGPDTVLREDGRPMLDPAEFRRSADKPSAKDKNLKKGGDVMESKKMMGKEVAFMKKKGAPSSMIKHEKAEMGMKKGGMASGGMPPEVMAAMRAKQAARQQPMRRPPPGGMPPPAQPPMGMKKGGVAKFAKGGGIESRVKTKGTVIRMAAGGSVSSRADGIAQRGKTKFTNY